MDSVTLCFSYRDQSLFIKDLTETCETLCSLGDECAMLDSNGLNLVQVDARQLRQQIFHGKKGLLPFLRCALQSRGLMEVETTRAGSTETVKVGSTANCLSDVVSQGPDIGARGAVHRERPKISRLGEESQTINGNGPAWNFVFKPSALSLGQSPLSAGDLIELFSLHLYCGKKGGRLLSVSGELSQDF